MLQITALEKKCLDIAVPFFGGSRSHGISVPHASITDLEILLSNTLLNGSALFDS